MDLEKRLSQLEEVLADLKEEVFLCHLELDKIRTESIAMKNFIQNLYESCHSIDAESELTVEEVLKNLMENIRVFARDHNIGL